jgi:hypothetical protein
MTMGLLTSTAKENPKLVKLTSDTTVLNNANQGDVVEKVDGLESI